MTTEKKRERHARWNREYRKKFPEKIRAHDRERYKLRREKQLAYKKEYYLRNREKILAYHEKYHRENRDVLLMKMRVSRANRLGGGGLTLPVLQRLYEENIQTHGTLTCCLCGGPILFGEDSLEHKRPFSRGGTNDFENLGIAHYKCNSGKKDKTYEEYVVAKTGGV